MSEWNEQLAAGLAQNLGSALEAWALDFWQLFRMAEGEHKAADDLRALLAQRDAELKALRGQVETAREEIEALHGAGVLSWTQRLALLAALSDNQEG